MNSSDLTRMIGCSKGTVSSRFGSCTVYNMDYID